MKSFIVSILLLSLAATAVQAQTTPATSAPVVTYDAVTVRINETASGLGASERYEIVASSATAWNTSGRLRIFVDEDAGPPAWTTEHAGSSKTVEKVREDAKEGTLRSFEIDISGVHALKDGDRFSVTVTHTDAESTYEHKLAYAARQLVVYAIPREGRAPTSAQLGAFNPTLNGDEEHAVRMNSAAGFSYDVTFSTASTPGSTQATDLNPYLFLALGLIVGFVVAYFIFRRGATRAKALGKGGQMESGAMLEARRRTLMAAMKELEVAHEAKEIPDSAYSPLKEEYKAQTVRVLRSLEEKKEAPKP